MNIIRRKWLRIGTLLAIVVLAAIMGLVLIHTTFWEPRHIASPYQTQIAVIAHRGASDLAPENTLAALRRAIELGVDSVEIDVRLSKDGEVVLMHDADVSRTTNGSGKVGNLTLQELKELDAGSWFDPEFAGEQIPTLQEVIDLTKGRVVIDIELKNFSPLPTQLESKVRELLSLNGIENQVVVSSFNPFSLIYFRRANPEVPTELLYGEVLPSVLNQRWLASVAHPDGMRPASGFISKGHVDSLHARGHRVTVWTVDDPDEMRRMIDMGVDGIITNKPDVLIEVLNSLSN